MALTSTTLSATCTPTSTTIAVTSATGFTAGNFILVENEFMQQTGAANGTVVPVRRGLDGTVQANHNAAAFTCTGLGTDFPGPAPGQCITYGPYAPDGKMAGYYTNTVAGPIAPTPGIHVINGSGALAMTLVAPTGAQEGAILIVESKNLNANTVTASPAWIGAAGTGIATMAATGGNLMLKACGGKWTVIGSSGAAFT
jgi:hypothetical protein